MKEDQYQSNDLNIYLFYFDVVICNRVYGDIYL